MYGYLATFNGKQTEIYAETSYSAYVKAVEFFKPAKSKKHLVNVYLCERPDGSTVTQVVTN